VKGYCFTEIKTVVTGGSVTRGLSQEGQSLAEGCSLVTAGDPLAKTQKKRCICKPKNKNIPKNAKKTTTERILDMKMPTKGGPIFTFRLTGGAARPFTPLSVTPLVTGAYAGNRPS